MQFYKIQLKINSALITPIQGDTLFGHICWGIRYNDGEKSLVDFLSLYEGQPPLIISNAFPRDTLPMPLLHPENPDYNISLTGLNHKKKLKKVKYIPTSLFKSNEPITETSIFVKLNTEVEIKNNYSETTERVHNTINRFNGATVEDGGLFPVNEIWYDNKFVLDIYIRSTFSVDKLKSLFEQGLENGFGADKSTGKGQLEISSVKEESGFLQSGNRMLSLGGFVNNNQNLLNMRADVFTKHGKLGGHFVHEMSPFKKPVVMFKEGATMDSAMDIDYVGKLLGNIHGSEKIRHHAYAPLVYFNEEAI